ncbi:DUF3105 domain-containing protein [Wenjunlia tyrosinilytica]|uniref:Membrane protein n=1 Tax=Wenjunlia tyrosinilytica TaxID=1544741 RepID=A0A918DYZ9_9ACTN|nr:DUF3105 domain-containing protein [Wenjunlia tyrosinilytica]GGO92339.1 membrane protein [Wenjunlia tyrosinilytica]
MGSAKQNASARRARAEEMRRAEAARERRNRIIAVVAGVVVLAGMVGGGWAIIASASKDDNSASSKPPKARVQGEKTYGGLTFKHVSHSVKYPQSPPVGGDHDPVWQNCNGDVYDKPLRNENAVHALEHGSVWVTYNSKAGKADIKTLADMVKQKPYSLMSPFPSQSGVITLSAWGHQLTVDSAKDPRVNQFFKWYVNGEQTREKGAACTGGKPTP